MRPVRLVVVVALVVAGCSASQRERSIKATLSTVNEMRDAFVVFDRNTQDAIVAIAPSYERGLAALLVYRKRREAVVEAFAVVYRAIATAATTDEYTALPEMIAAARRIAEAFDKLKDEEHAP